MNKRNLIERSIDELSRPSIVANPTVITVRAMLAQFLEDNPISDTLQVPQNDMVNHPQHYTSHPSGVECIDITRHYCFSIGSAIKYLWRAGLKKDASLTDNQKEIEDLNKAIWYIKDRIKQLETK